MTHSIVKQRAIGELKRREEAGSGKLSLLRAFLSPQQRAFIDHPSKRKVARCGRRAGKTVAAAAYMVEICLSAPKTPCLFLGLTRESAMRNVWQPLLDILDSLGLAYEATISKGLITFDNGSFILVFGADATGAAKRLRGTFWKLIIADEFGFVVDKSADDLVTALEPSLADLDGILCLLSSPSIIADGMLYHVDVGKIAEAEKELPEDPEDVLRWARFHWTLLDNPHFQKPPTRKRIGGGVYKSYGEQYLDEQCRKKHGGDPTAPEFRREWRGEWAFSDQALVYPFSSKNKIKELAPYTEEHFGIGMDLGSATASAIVVVKYSPYVRDVQVVYAWKKAGLLVDEMAAHLKFCIDTYKADIIVADTGGLGKVPVEEFRRRYLLPVQAAEKQEKAFFQRIVANDLHAGYIKALPTSSLFEEWSKIVKDPKTGEELPKQENHLADAFLYIYRRIYNTFLKDFESPPTEEESIRAKLEERVQRSTQEWSEDFTATWDGFN